MSGAEEYAISVLREGQWKQEIRELCKGKFFGFFLYYQPFLTVRTLLQITCIVAIPFHHQRKTSKLP